MEPTDADTVAQLTDKLTAAALAHVDGLSPEDYDKADWYGNPAADMTNGQDFNWSNNLAPENCVKLIRSYDDLSEGVAAAALQTEAACYDYSPDTKNMNATAFIGLVKAIAGRFGVGAAGERFFANSVHSLPALPGDENAGIDERCAFGVTAQVKTMDSYRNKSKKDADILVWVQPGDEWSWEVKK